MIELTPDKKRLAMLAVLLLALVVVVGLRLLSSDGSTASAEEHKSGTSLPKVAVGLLTADPDHLVRIARLSRALSRTYYTGGDARDPMSPLARETTTPRAEPRTSGAGETIALPLMSLYGIIWDPKTPIAMIDGMDLRVGDRIKGARITEIGIDRVVFSYRSKRFVLTVR